MRSTRPLSTLVIQLAFPLALTLVAAGVVLTGPSSARAQEPAPAAAEGPASGDAPSGLWVGGGMDMWVNSGVYAGMRLEVGIPLPFDLPLSVIVPMSFHGRSQDFFFGSVKTRFFSLIPGIQYEYVLPLEIAGAVSVVGEVGLGFALGWAKFRNNGAPNNTDTDAHAAMRFSVLARYYFAGVPGLFVMVQPVGVTAVFANGSTAFYEFMVGGGYRFGG